jgi:hypothetical protein
MDDKPFARNGAVRELRPGRRRRFVPARELAEALADAPSIDYEQLRADLDAVAGPGSKDWYEWAAGARRHVDLSLLEEN